MFKAPPATASRSEREAYVKGLAAITISIFALLLAINSVFGGSNSSRVLNGTIAANNYWAWYQAKNVRATIFETAGQDAKAAVQRADMEEIAALAKAAEADREVAKGRSSWFSYAGMALQLGIVLSSAAILAVSMALFYSSILVGGIGAVLFLTALGV
jgi:hypothetical protein